MFQVAVRLLSHIQLFETPWTAASQAPLSLTLSQSLLKLLSTESGVPSNHLVIRCLLLHLLSVFPSIRVFPNEEALWIRWPKYWSFSISPSNEYLGLTSFRMDWLDLLALQGTLKSVPSEMPHLSQHHHLTHITVIIQHYCQGFVCRPWFDSWLGRSPGEGIDYPLQYPWASLVAQLVKNPPAMWETWVWSLGWEDPLEKGTATHSSVLAWKIPCTVHGVAESQHDWETITYSLH